jgi:hypothetical protein
MRASGGVLLAVLAVARPAGAEPQVSVGVTVGAAGEGLDHGVWTRRTAFHLGLHGDVIFGRRSTSSFGLGPYAEVLTHAFDEVELGGGVSGLLPVLDTFPVIVSAGAYARKGGEGFGLEPGVAGEICWGPRSYNFHSRYVLSGGLIGQVRYGLGPSRETSIVVAAQVDVMLLAMPVLFLISAARGSSPEAAPLR